MQNGPEHLDTATALRNLCYLYVSQSNFKAAEPHCRRALTIRKKTLGLRHKDTIASLDDLAYIYRNLGKEIDAITLYAEAGDRNAMEDLIFRYTHGLGVPKNTATAAYWQKRVAYAKIMKTQTSPSLSEGDGVDLTPLHHAVQQEDVETLRDQVARYKQFVNVKDKNGQTPLHRAAGSGRIEIVKLLVDEFGADTTIADKDGFTPFLWASKSGHVEIVRLLMTDILELTLSRMSKFNN